MEDLIPLINKLQSVFKKTGMQEIKLPQIVVVGAQSSGKSSVLESLVKRSFLPRGPGMVTRCPIILQLHKIEASSISNQPIAEEYYRFSQTPDKTYTNFDEVRDAIEGLQVELAGEGRGISMEPIILEVFSPNVVNLTLVDLPGIVKVALPGQPDDIEEQVQNLIKQFITNESAIILAVSQATSDIVTSESIKIAKEVDPAGDRTIAVVTKLDLMGEGTDLGDVLCGGVIPVKLGIIGVVNRSQEDILNNTSAESAQEKEEAFLRKTYPQIHAIGTPYLGKRLNKLLKEHIHKNLPFLRQRIATLREEYEAKLSNLGKVIKPEESSWIIMEATSKFTNKFREITQFRPAHHHDQGDQEPFGVRVNDTFENFRSGVVIREVDFAILQQEMKNTMNFEGYSSIEEAFKRIVNQQIKAMLPASLQCAKDFRDILSQTAELCMGDLGLKNLNVVILRVVDELLDKQLKKVTNRIKEYIEIQTGMISSSDEEFVDQLVGGPEEEDAAATATFCVCVGQGFPQKDPRTLYTLNLIMTYLHVVKRDLGDYVPKSLMHHLAKKMTEMIPAGVKAATLWNESRLVAEPEEIRAERGHIVELLQNLNEAEKMLREITMY